MKIGTIPLKNPLILAPMCDVTNLPFRLLCREYGAAMTFSQMVSAEALIRENEASLRLAHSIPSEHPYGIQLEGNCPASLRKAVFMLEAKADLFDLNAGCPADHVNKQGCGAELLKDPDLLLKCVRAMVSATRKPVTVKMRRVAAREKKSTIDLAKKLEKTGIAALAIHPRTQRQTYDVPADLSLITDIKQSLHIPVIGNGDLLTPESVKIMLKQTSCDCVMIARGAIGNPFFFQQVSTYLSSGKLLPSQTIKERLIDYMRYTDLAKKHLLQKDRSLKEYLIQFTKRVDGGKRVRIALGKINDEQRLLEGVNDFLRHDGQDGKDTFAQGPARQPQPQA